MRPIRDGEIQFVGDEVRFRGAALRMLERLARKSARNGGHKVSPRQVAEGLVRGMQQGAEIHAELVRATDQVQRVVKKLKEVNRHG